ncbi:hypothetical protein OAT84_01635 [Gammaproteobacteria bacterium]|nr:hypothetical protein [Gammaproteobacteria bacterium]
MLVIRRSKKIDALAKLMEVYSHALSKNIGTLKIKDQAFFYNSGLDIAYFNLLAVIGVSVNFLEVSALLEASKQKKVPFMGLVHDGLIDIKQLFSQELAFKGRLSGLHYSLKYEMMQYDAHPAAQVIEVKTPEQFYEWVDVYTHAYDLDPTQVEALFKGAVESHEMVLHIMQVYQKTVACTLSVRYEDQVLLLWDTVLPMYRRQGLGSMMMLKRLFEFQEQGVKDAYAVGFYSSYDLARSIGFKNLVTLPFYRYDPPIEHTER